MAESWHKKDHGGQDYESQDDWAQIPQDQELTHIPLHHTHIYTPHDTEYASRIIPIS